MNCELQHSWRNALPAAAALVGLMAFATGCGNGLGPGDGPPPVVDDLPRALTALEVQAIQSSNQFGIDLLREVAAAEPDENIILSPFSASVALGMAYAGANGTTATAMRETLGWGTRSRDEILAAYRELPGMLQSLDSRVTVKVANAMWVRNTFPVRPEYTSDMKQFFAADVRSGDFGPATVADMNSWASAKTNGLIPKVVDDLSPDLVLMLMNALYFKGSWRAEFDPARTTLGPFRTSGGAQPQVRMMRRTGDMAYAQSADAQWVELPYGNTSYVMTLVLPQEGTSARQWLQLLDSAVLAQGVSALAERDVELSMPKFRLKVNYQLRQPLTEMGMGIAFKSSQADFSRIGEGLSISHVKQDVYIDVNEEGTEAAAVTQVGIRTVSLPQREIVNLDRPFLFFLRDRIGGTVLFAGLIEEPKSQ